MNVSVRPQTKLAAALLAAGLVATAPAGVPMAQEVPSALRSVAVQPASFVTDALWDLGTVIGAASDAADLGVQLVGSLPTYVLGGLVAAVQDPGVSASVLSALLQLYLNPDATFDSLPRLFIINVLWPLASVLPAPLGPSATDTGWVNDIIAGASGGIGNLFTGLPNTIAGAIALNAAFAGSPIFRAIRAVEAAVTAPVDVVIDAVRWLGDLPAEVEASIESAIQNPAEIPGLLSNLIFSANGLLGTVLYEVMSPLFLLPAPIGFSVTDEGFARTAYDDIVSGISDLLTNLLPTPVTPTPFAATLAAPPSATSVSAAEVGSVPAGDGPVVTVDALGTEQQNLVAGDLVPNADVPIDEVQQVAVDAAEDPEVLKDAPADVDMPKDVDVPKDAPKVATKDAAGDNGGPGLSKVRRHAKIGADDTVGSPSPSKGPRQSKRDTGGEAGTAAAS